LRYTKEIEQVLADVVTGGQFHDSHEKISSKIRENSSEMGASIGGILAGR
jgi:hypothetical protein